MCWGDLPKTCLKTSATWTKHLLEGIARGSRSSGVMRRIADQDIAHSGRLPRMGWPEYDIPFRLWRPDVFLTDQILRSGNLINLPEDQGRRSGGNMDPSA